MVELLFWPAVLAYGEAAVAYAGNVRYPGPGPPRDLGRARRLARADLPAGPPGRARRGVSVGHLGRIAQPLRLAVVGGYLVWGCTPRYRLLGLAVMPFAAVLLVASYLGRRDGHGRVARPLDPLPRGARRLRAGRLCWRWRWLRRSVALYLWEERALKLRRPGLLRLRAPSLAHARAARAADGGRRAAAAHAGHGGRVRPRGLTRPADASSRWSVWALFAAFVVVRPRGRRAAYLQLAGFALVLAAPLGLLVTHLS